MEERQHPAACDCERIRPGFFAQPVNSLSSLAYVVAGLALCRRSRRRAGASPTSTMFGVLVAANGVGSIGFHGPGGRVGHWLHDTALLGTMATMVVENVVAVGERGERAAVPAATVATGVAAAALVAAPTSTTALSAAVGAAATTTQALAVARTDLTPATRRRLARSAALLAIGATVNVLTRTGARYCRPDARLQGHALWHICTAASLYEWGAATSA